ncbi:MAG: M20/M25/M40 family metallo-hydrolase [Planctomycetota bacterium]|nr:M20/M25/M40 family metallo-hydrolase [Planctomycetota bacterium]
MMPLHLLELLCAGLFAAFPSPLQDVVEADPFVPEVAAPAGFDRTWAAEQTLSHLKSLIEINTTNGNDPDQLDQRVNGNEMETARWFDAQLSGLDGVETHVLDAGDGRANFIARLRAVEPVNRPVLLMGHMDVVGADGLQWDTPPFEPTILDGYLYGRGAIDCKGPLAAELTAFLALAKRRAQLKRDVIFLATAAEEGGPDIGIGRVLSEHRELLGDAEFAMNEGGRVRMENEKILSVNIQTTEKVAYSVQVTSSGPGGHGSVPLPDNALAALARAVSRVHDWRAPAALNETTTLYFQQQALIETDPLLRAAMEALTAATPGSPEFLRADQLLSTEPHYSAVLRSASSLTMLNGGFRSNVIPSSGTAVFNLRVLPGGDVDEIVSEMNRVGAEPSVKFVLDGSPRISPPPSPVDTELFRAMAETAEVMVPDVVVVPFMSTGGTDGAALRSIGIPTYGILPIPMPLEDELRMHGDNERAPVKGLGWAAEYIYRTLLAVAG